MADPLRPLSVRHGNEADVASYDALHEGVPTWLNPTLKTWLAELLPTYPVEEERTRAKLQRLERDLRTNLGGASANALVADLLNRVWGDGGFCLDVVDATLRLGIASRAPVYFLDLALEEASSAWRVELDEGPTRLVRRVDESHAELARMEIARGGRAAQHLRNAWTAAWGRTPSPSEAYREAVRAVEAGLAPIVSPSNPRATLGTMIKDIEQSPAKWKLPLEPASQIDPVDAFRRQLELLWTSQFDRHGTADDSVPLSVTPVQGQSAVSLATLIVHWAQTGAFARRTTES